MSLLVLVVDDEPDVETLFRQQFRRDLRAGRFAMEFACYQVGTRAKSGVEQVRLLWQIERAKAVLLKAIVETLPAGRRSPDTAGYAPDPTVTDRRPSQLGGESP